MHLIAAHHQSCLTVSLQVCGADVPAGVRPAVGGPARGQAVLPTEYKHPATGSGGPPHESRQEQLSASTQGLMICLFRLLTRRYYRLRARWCDWNRATRRRQSTFRSGTVSPASALSGRTRRWTRPSLARGCCLWWRRTTECSVARRINQYLRDSTLRKRLIKCSQGLSSKTSELE